MKRIGLFGGTFNPIHRGHLQVIQEVKPAFDLDQILLVPAALPPHKEPGGVADAEDRMQMIRLAVAGVPDLMNSVTVSDVELKRPGPSYTIDTVRYFMQTLPKHTHINFILGLDAFLEIDTWKSYQDLLRRIPFIVMSRPRRRGREEDPMQDVLATYLKSKISSSYRFNAEPPRFVHDDRRPIYIFEVTPLDISSTQIRTCVKKGRDITSKVPNSVEDFIQTRGLYL